MAVEQPCVALGENRGAEEGWDRYGLGTAGLEVAWQWAQFPFLLLGRRQLFVAVVPPQCECNGTQWPGCLHPTTPF